MAALQKVALVTGAGTGIGKAVALALMKEGYATVLAGRRADKLEETASEGKSTGAKSLAVPTDVGYTLLLGGGGALVLTPIASSRPPFDPVRDFEPIALLVTTGLAMPFRRCSR